VATPPRERYTDFEPSGRVFYVDLSDTKSVYLEKAPSRPANIRRLAAMLALEPHREPAPDLGAHGYGRSLVVLGVTDLDQAGRVADFYALACEPE
jgi:hypothetical protein